MFYQTLCSKKTNVVIWGNILELLRSLLVKNEHQILLQLDEKLPQILTPWFRFLCAFLKTLCIWSTCGHHWSLPSLIFFSDGMKFLISKSEHVNSIQTNHFRCHQKSDKSSLDLWQAESPKLQILRSVNNAHSPLHVLLFSQNGFPATSPT